MLARHAGDYRERGFARVPSLVPPGVLDALRDASDDLTYASAGPYGSICHNPWRRDERFWQLAIALDLGALAREIAGIDAPVWFQDHLIAKPPGGKQAIAWHQDYSYWPLDRPVGVTLWIALDDADRVAGCLEYVAGSHLGGERRPADFTAGAAQPTRLESLAPIDEPAADAAAIAVEVSAGDALAHDPLVWHRSGPNAGARPRRAWSISIVTAETRWDPDHAPHPFTSGDPPGAGEALDGPLFPRL